MCGSNHLLHRWKTKRDRGPASFIFQFSVNGVIGWELLHQRTERKKERKKARKRGRGNITNNLPRPAANNYKPKKRKKRP